MVLPYDNMDYGVDEVGARNIPELTDVSLTNLANDEVLVYNSSIEKWENKIISSTTISGLTDTSINNLQDGQVLYYDNSSSKWINYTLVTTTTLENLTDTNINNKQDKDFLLYDSVTDKWLNTPSNLDNLKNITITDIGDNEVLKYNSTSGKWENEPANLAECGDTNITNLQNNQVLKYNSTNSKWENAERIDSLNELGDVSINSASNNNVLKYNSTSSEWENTFINLTELADTNITSLQNGDLLKYNSTNQKWETISNLLENINDVSISSVQNNEVLKYNSTSGKWENSDRIDTLNELGDVVISSVQTNELLRYNGSNWVNTHIAFDNNFTNVNFTSLTNGDLIKYDGSNFVNFAPTYLDGSGIANDYLIKVVNGATVQTSFKETSTAYTGTSLKTYIDFGITGVVAGSIETEVYDTTKTRMHLTSQGINTAKGITITSEGRVGIGVVAPTEDFHIDGNIQLDTGGVQRSKIIFYDGQNDHSHAHIDALGSGTNGGSIVLYTKVDGGSVTEKMRILANGNVGINTTTPAYKLDVDGTTNIAGALTTSGITNTGTITSDTINLSAGGTTNLNLTNLNDIYIVGTPQQNEVLQYNTLSQSWINSDALSINTITASGQISTSTNSIADAFIGNALYLSRGSSSGVNDFSIGNASSSTKRRINIYTDQTSLILGQIDSNTRYGLTNANYLTASSLPIALGTESAHSLILGTNNTARLEINSTGGIAFGGSYGSAGQVLRSNGSSSAPTWTNPSAVNPTDYEVTGTGLGSDIMARIRGITDTFGGQLNFYTYHDDTELVNYLSINSWGAVAFNSNYGSAGQLLQSNGNNSPPTWTTTLPAINFSSNVTFNTTSGFGDKIFFFSALQAGTWYYQTAISHNYDSATYGGRIEFKSGYGGNYPGGASLNLRAYIAGNGLNVNRIQAMSSHLYISDIIPNANDCYIGYGANNFRKIILQASNASGTNDAQIYFVLNGVWKSWSGISSDSRIKLNQEDYPTSDSMNIVRTIKVKKYFNTELQQEVRGFIAQEVEEILPEAVTTHDLSDAGKPSDFKMLDYRRLQVHSFGAIQHLDGIIQTQQVEINDLKTENNLLKTQVEELKAQVEELNPLKAQVEEIKAQMEELKLLVNGVNN